MSSNNIRKATHELLKVILDAQDDSDLAIIELDGLIVAANVKKRSEVSWHTIGKMLGERIDD